MSTSILPTLALIVAIVAATTDLRHGRIPNQLTFPTMLIAVVGHGISRGAAGMLESAIGLVVCAAVPGVVYKASRGRGIGGGDLKLFAALGALLGPMRGLEAELSSFLLLGIFAMFRLAFVGQLGRTVANSLRITAGLFVPTLRSRNHAESLAMTEMRMGPAIALAVVIVLGLPHLMRWLPWLG